MVEATKDCDINLGKYAKRAQVHKIRETNFVDLLFKEIMKHWVFTKFLHENGKVGRVMFFLKNDFIALFPFKNFTRIKLHSFQDLEFQKESSTMWPGLRPLFSAVSLA
jgi:hypothetical protein